MVCKCAQRLVAIRDCDNYTFHNEKCEHVIILCPAASTAQQDFLQYAVVCCSQAIRSCLVLCQYELSLFCKHSKKGMKDHCDRVVVEQPHLVGVLNVENRDVAMFAFLYRRVYCGLCCCWATRERGWGICSCTGERCATVQ